MPARLRNFGLAGFFVVFTASASIADEVVATAGDSGKSVSVHVGQVLTVNLTGTHLSGKYWRLNADLTPELSLSGRTTEGGVLPGEAETTSFSFKTNVAGKLVFKASYLAIGALIPTTNDVEFTVDVLP